MSCIRDWSIEEDRAVDDLKLHLCDIRLLT